ARETRETAAQVLVIGNPRPPRVLMTEHPEVRPILQLLQHQRARRARHETERMSTEIHQRRAAAIMRQRETLAKGVQRIRLIEAAGECRRWLVSHSVRH